jgi:hypothetical protein
VKKGGTYAVFLAVEVAKEWVFIRASRAVQDAVASGAPQQYEGVPSLTTAKLRRKYAKNLLARSPKIHTSACLLLKNAFLPVEKKCITAGKGGRLQ